MQETMEMSKGRIYILDGEIGPLPQCEGLPCQSLPEHLAPYGYIIAQLNTQ